MTKLLQIPESKVRLPATSLDYFQSRLGKGTKGEDNSKGIKGSKYHRTQTRKEHEHRNQGVS